jgi:hypothetical protein
MKISGCDSETFSADVPLQWRSCLVAWPYTMVNRKAWFGIDRTPPQVVAMQPSRPADYGGWFNHPVAVGFRGADATSGVRSCSSAVYGGPDGAGVALAGTCTDVAGNTGSGSFRLNYDATPPASAEVRAVPGNRRMALRWAMPADATSMQVARITGDGSPDLVYQGAGGGFTDRRLRNGRRYRYLVTSIDRAGNRARARASGVPTSLPLLSPAKGAHVGQPPLLLWKAVRRARYYNVQLYKGRRKILTRWPRGEQLQLGKSWRFAGRKRKLRPGTYDWFVFPGFGERSKHRYGKLLGSSTFTVKR